MSKQQTLHEKAARHLEDLKRIVDQLKNAGECPLDGWNALMNIQERANALSKRCGGGWAERGESIDRRA
jgi:hypothetical protein